MRLMPGALRLIVLRAAVVVLSASPALVAALAGVTKGAARHPYYTDVEGRMPWVHLMRLLGDLPTAFIPAALASVVLAIFADQVLTGGAFVLLDPGRIMTVARVRVLATVRREGLAHFWTFLRAVGLGVVLLAAGIAVIRLPFKRLAIVGYHSGWSAETAFLTLPGLSTALILLWVSAAGAWVFWCRLITVADGRRCVLRTGLLVLRVFLRSPFRSLGAFMLVTHASLLLSGALLAAWRQAEPGSTGGAMAWFIGWLGSVLLQAYLWYRLIRAGRRLWALDRYAELKARPDHPLGLLAKLALWRRWRPAESRTC